MALSWLHYAVKTKHETAFLTFNTAHLDLMQVITTNCYLGIISGKYLPNHARCVIIAKWCPSLCGLQQHTAACMASGGCLSPQRAASSRAPHSLQPPMPTPYEEVKVQLGSNHPTIHPCTIRQLSSAIPAYSSILQAQVRRQCGRIAERAGKCTLKSYSINRTTMFETKQTTAIDPGGINYPTIIL